MNIDDMDEDSNSKALWTRRAVLKCMAGAPLAITFGMLASPLMRFLKPTMKPGNFFQTADLPTTEQAPLFNVSDFPDNWPWLPFSFPMKSVVFNPTQYEIKAIPGVVIRLKTSEVVAFSRVCTKQSSHILNYLNVRPSVDPCCGCANKNCAGVCIGYSKNPVLICPHGCGVFDVTQNGRMIIGSAPHPARQFTVDRNGDWISISGLKNVSIV